MKILQKVYKANEHFNPHEIVSDFKDFQNNSLIFIFINENKKFWIEQIHHIFEEFKESSVVGCSSAGHIVDEFIYDSECAVTAIKFNKAKFQIKVLEEINSLNSKQAGIQIATIAKELHSHAALIFTEGISINGSQLVEGINSVESKTYFAGGLAGDGIDFKNTEIFADKKVMKKAIVVIYFDENVIFKTASASGWKPFGMERRITRSENNIVYEIDKSPAINLYKDYIGENASQLVSYGLRFPIAINPNKTPNSPALIRSLLNVDTEKGSLFFAGDVNEGAEIKLMKTSKNELVSHAKNAIKNQLNFETKNDGLLFAISCVGRRLIMGESTEEEFEFLELKTNAKRAGFYSYGEISTNDTNYICSFYNQTFTSVFISEK